MRSSEPFVAAAKWCGVKKGWYFGTGEPGTGYYTDNRVEIKKKAAAERGRKQNDARATRAEAVKLRLETSKQMGDFIESTVSNEMLCISGSPNVCLGL